MNLLTEQILIYGSVILLSLLVVIFYLLAQKRLSEKVKEKIRVAREEGTFEPVSLHPVVDPNNCIRTGACISACPEKDILGIVNGKATTINASRCVGHGACFHACPTQAITLCIGTETRGVDLPHVDPQFETNIPGIFIAGELGGMGLIRNAVEQGRQAVESMARRKMEGHNAEYDLIIIGAGPAGISASLNARKHGMKALTLEQDSLGGTVFTFPRAKVVMTAPMELPLYGRVKLLETTKQELLSLWLEVMDKHQISLREHCKVDQVQSVNGHFEVKTAGGESFTSRFVLLAIGRRGSPRKLGVPGETSEKVAYRLLEPERIQGKRILVVGGGDAAIESALLLAEDNELTLSYRNDAFSRLKVANKKKIEEALAQKKVNILFKSNVKEIREAEVVLSLNEEESPLILPNDLVFIFAGGELPTAFLKGIGLEVSTKFGEAILKHQ